MKKPHHPHGDLRATLLQIGMALLAERDVEELSLREIARLASVSATAVYRYFPNKAALLAALAEQGLHALVQEQKDAARQAGDGPDAFAATGRVYIRFALRNPALFRLIYGRKLIEPMRNPEIQTLLFNNVKSRLAEGTTETVIHREALLAWAMVHGVAMLILDGQIPQSDELIDTLIRAPSAEDGGRLFRYPPHRANGD